MPEQSAIESLRPRPRNDAYTILLVVSLVAMLVACVLLWLDITSYPSVKPTDTAPIVVPTEEKGAGGSPGSSATPGAPAGPAAAPGGAPATPPAATPP
ncbi:MAG: hypothetical protein C4297_08480 [Gemmataceae bacterium]